jgi:pilus assembly protein CpaE
MVRPLNFILLTGDPEDARELRAGLDADHRVRVLASSDDPESVYADVVRWRPSAVIVTVSGGPETDWTLCRQINALCPETVIICASRNPSPDLILDSLRAGAREFLRLPIIADELKTVIDRTAEFRAGESRAEKKRGRVIAVFSNKGGCGVSFIAANLAAALGVPTALADLNLQAASQDLFFGVKPRYSIVDLIENRNRLDDQLIASFLVESAQKVSILPSPHDAEAAEDINADQIIDVLELLRERFDCVVLDLPHTFNSITVAALDHADEILVVLTLDILAARAAQRALTIFGRLGYSRDKIRIVLNRWNKQSDLELKHVEKFLGQRITTFISEDYKAAVSSINLGQPLVASQSSSTIVAELKRLAAVCGGANPHSGTDTRKGILSSIFRRQTQPLKVEREIPEKKEVVHEKART